MALVRSTILSQTAPSQMEDVLRQNVDFYQERVLLAQKMRKLLQTRLYLARTVHEARTRPSLHANLTKLELGLQEATNGYLKLVMERQLLNTAIQKSVQSTILHAGQKNFLAHPQLNVLEANAAEQMKRMATLSRGLRVLKETTDRQCVEIKAAREKLAARFAPHAQKLAAAAHTSFSDPELAARVEKKIRGTNILATLMSSFVAQNVTNGDPRLLELVQLVRKWRTPRSFEYYKAKCAGS